MGIVFRQILEKNVFGVCQWFANKLSIKSNKVRFFFIYFSFIGLGSPLMLYLVLAFVLEHKNYIKGAGKRRVWDL